MAQSCLRQATLVVNCGFSRTAIRELTNRNKGNSKGIDIQTRAMNFKTYSRIVQSTVKMSHTLTAVDTMDHSLIVTVQRSFSTSTKSGIPKNLELTMRSNFQSKTGRLCLCTKRRVTQWPNVKHAEMNTTTTTNNKVPTSITL